MDDLYHRGVRDHELIEVMFAQLLALPVEKRPVARVAIKSWEDAKGLSMLGIVDLFSCPEYKRAYEMLRDLGVEVGGMVEPNAG